MRCAMPFDPNKTDRWSVHDLRHLEREEHRRRVRETVWACLGIVFMLAAIIAFLLVVG